MATPHRSSLQPAERARLRRVVRWGSRAIIGLEILALSVVALPAAAYVIPVVDAKLLEEITTKLLPKIILNINSIQLGTWPGVGMNWHLDKIQYEQKDIRVREDQHTRQLKDTWESDIDDVTKTPTEKLQGISFQDANASATLRALVPGYEPWGDYYDEYLASADTTLVTLQTSLDALYAHNQQIQSEAALDRIAELANGIGSGSSPKGLLAMDELEVQSSLEVARQLHALRSQHALRATIYATAESHKLGVEARSRAEDEQAGCRTVASALAGMVGTAAGVISC